MFTYNNPKGCEFYPTWSHSFYMFFYMGVYTKWNDITIETNWFTYNSCTTKRFSTKRCFSFQINTFRETSLSFLWYKRQTLYLSGSGRKSNKVLKYRSLFCVINMKEQQHSSDRWFMTWQRDWWSGVSDQLLIL